MNRTLQYRYRYRYTYVQVPNRATYPLNLERGGKKESERIPYSYRAIIITSNLYTYVRSTVKYWYGTTVFKKWGIFFCFEVGIFIVPIFFYAPLDRKYGRIEL